MRHTLSQDVHLSARILSVLNKLHLSLDTKLRLTGNFRERVNLTFQIKESRSPDHHP